jgi:hypothetical protein
MNAQRKSIKEDYDRHEWICSFAPPGIIETNPSRT